MAAEYDENGTTSILRLDPETQEWMEGFDAQREAWAQYAEAQAREAQVCKARRGRRRGSSIEEQASYHPGRQRGHLCPTRPWPRCVRS